MGIFAALIDGIGKLGGTAFDKPAPSGRDAFKPQRQALALEPRIMFDGAAASAADQHHEDPAHATDAAAQHPATPPRAIAEPAPATAAPAPGAAPTQTLLVVDSRVDQLQALTAQPPAGVSVLVVKTGEDGVAAISAALQQLGQVDSIQILSHGAAGQFTLGNRTVSSDNVDQLASVLQSWRTSLKAGADIQLYGCDVGAGAAGQTLVNELAHWTGADVGASTDATGSASAGGNWALETKVGDIDKPLALSAAEVSDFSGLLANASPTVALSAAGSDVLLSGQFSFTASFTNPSTQVGFAPYIDLFLPATGKDGDDGATFVSATYLGQAIKTFTVTFDANGDATHPLAKDSTGAAVVLHAADYGMRAGDQLVVLQLPNASITQGQPAVDIVVTAQLSNLADTTASDPAPDLVVKARGGFQFGNDSADDPTIDPSLVEAGTHDFTIHPTVVSLTQSVPMTDGQTVSGPNYPHTIDVTASAAAGQTVTNVVISQDVPGNVLVTSITPGPGGVLSSITSSTGGVLTAPADIQAAFTRGDYISNYTVTYATLTGTATSTVTFYVPEADASGVPVIDPVTGAPVTIVVAPPTASADWTPLDPRDVSTGTISATGTGDTASFVVQPIAIYKDAAVTTNVGSPDPSPGDTLTYTLQVQMSDYFAFGENLLTQGQFNGVDMLSDGQTFVPGSGVLSYTVGGVTKSVPMVSTVTPNADGSTTLTLDIGQTLRNAGETTGSLAGDLAFDPVRDGATTLTITYQAVIGQNLTQTRAAGGSEPINEGDSVGNNATITATLLGSTINLTGGVASDNDFTEVLVPPSNVDIQIVDVNGSTPPGTVELHPGDVVTFQMSYDLVTGDYEQFILTGYLPLPLFDLSTITWSRGTGIGQFNIGPGNTSPDTLASVTNGAGNSVVFDFGNNENPGVNGTRIEVQFKLQVSDIPFGDQRSVTAQAQSDQLTTIDQEHILSQDAVIIQSVAEPVLGISHGVVSSTGGSISGTTGTWAAPGSAGAPFTGAVNELTAVNGDIQGFDGGDTLRMATAIENTGGGGAFDVTTSITLPTGLTFVGGALTDTIKVYRGDGTQLVLGTDYSVTGDIVTFLDPAGVPSLLPGRAGTTADTNGTNLIVITYDVVTAAGIPSSSTLQSTATLSNYAGAPGGGDFTPADLTDVALEQVAVPVLTKVFDGGTVDDTDSSSASTTGSDVVVGESMLYDIVVTLPEGTAQNLSVDDLIPPGMSLDLSFNGGLGYELITTVAGSGALTSDYNGTVTIGSVSGVGGTVGADGVDARMTFSANSTAADNVTGNNSFVVRVRVIADDVAGNQAGTALTNDAQLHYTDPDSDTANGSTAIERVVARSNPAPTVTVREPTLTITQVTGAIPPLGVDFGDPVDYTITITNGTGSSDFNAYDISFTDSLPNQLTGLTLASVTYSGGATNNGGADFAIVGGVLQSVAGANIDIAKGGSIVLHVTGTVNVTVENVASLDNTASVQWTSLDGTDSTAQANERTGADGLLNGGALNDYRREATTSIAVLNGVETSRIGGLADTPASPDGTTGQTEQVAIGELVRYRVVSAIGEGETTNYRIQVTLDPGLEFLNDGTVKLAFISTNADIVPLATLNTDGTLNVVGNRSSAIAQPIAADLSGPHPDATLAPGRITVTTDANGRTVVTFDLGTLFNGDQDADLEGVTIEFSARVDNVATNVGSPATQLGVTVEHLVGNGSGGTDTRSVGATLFEEVTEPGFNGVVKQVDSFTPNATSTTSEANVSVRFTQNGDAPAYDVDLVDSFTGATNYAPTSISIGGTVFAVGSLPAGVTFTSSAAGISVHFDKIDPGVAVVVLYTVDVAADAAYANTDATLTWSSLPETFTTWGGSTVGADGTIDGERDGSGVAPNTYVLSEGAGLGLISGSLWDDSGSPTTSTTADGPALAGQTITLTWAGVDGDLATTADNLTFTTTTDANGAFNFSALVAGNYRVDAPGTVTLAQPVGELRPRIDTDATSALGEVVAAVGEGVATRADVGYVQENDAPVNTLPGTQNGLEDVLLAIAPISIADVDAGAGLVDVTLTVTKGVLDVTQATPGVTIGNEGTASMTLTGTVADLNVALARITYLGALNFNGNDTLTVLTRDNGNFGDANGDGIPGDPVLDNLQDSDVLQIILAPVNDPPQSVSDAASATEAGGVANTTAGVNPSGNMLANDLDVDIQTNADTLHLVNVRSVGTGVTVAPLPSNPVDLAGLYGTLSFSIGGGYTYTVDNDNPLVQALRTSGQTLTESFEYIMTDQAGAPDTSPTVPTLTITIHGANDTPVAVDDAGAAIEAGGLNNGTAGGPATGNVLVNDTDVDTVANGETKIVTGIRDVPESERDPLVAVAPGAPTVLTGIYGTLTIGSTGDYTYVVDDTNATVQGLLAGQTLDEVFSYQVTDAGGLSDLANLTITIRGSNDNPVAVDDAASATEAGGVNNATPGVDPTGNVLANDTDADTGDTKAVTELRTGDEAGAGTEGTVGIALVGSYGSLTLNADGSYTYVVDNTLAAVQALRLPTDTLVDNFSYTVTDAAGATDRATLAVTIHGADDTPVAVNDVGLAVEAGGVANGTPGTDPSGNVITGNDSDVDGNGEVLSIASYTEGATAGTVGSAFASQYGSLLLNADGSYAYTLDNNNVAVQALRTPTDTLTEVFTYTLSDAAGATTTATLTVTISGRNDTPVAVDDTADATEAGGVANGTPGVDPTGNVLANDTDVDGGASSPIDYGETQAVNSVRTGTEAGTGTDGTLGAALAGTYGTLTLNADGSYSYVVDNTNAAVQALRVGTQTLVDNFSYTVTDTAGATDRATLAITIHGANDAPVATDDVGTAVEAGGVANGTVGSPATGAVLSNDSDVDSAANGEVDTVTGIRTGTEAAGGAFTTVAASGTTSIAGTYGTLVIAADGSYTYTADDTNTAVQNLRAGQTLDEFFSYQVSDVALANDVAQLHITIQGANDTPVAVDDAASATEAGGVANATPGVNPTGNVLANDTDVDAGDTKTVSEVRTGDEAGTGTEGTVGAALVGSYGTLTLNADGTYTYVLDNTNAAVQALRLDTQTLVDNFSYTVSDTAGASDRATLAVTIHGANDTPVAVNDIALSVEAGGVANGTAGTNPSGNVITGNDSDVDSAANGEVLTIASYTEGATAGTVGSAFTTTYGSLLLNADGSYTYTLDNSNAAVQALRTPTDTLTEVFTYTLSDAAGATTTATLTVTISGRDDTPVAADDTADATEAGGVNNGTPGVDPTGNVLTNDTDVDGGASSPIDYGETQAVNSVRTGTEAGTGTDGTLGSALAGTYGTLTLNADGSYSYVVDNTNAAVQALRVGTQTLVDNFSYTVTDTAGATDRATLAITIHGANDAPVATDDVGTAVEAGGVANGTVGSPATGAVLSNDSDVDSAANGEVDTVTGIRTGTEAAGGAFTTVAAAGTTSIAGTYGTLVIAADGSYTYTADDTNTAVQNLRAGQTLDEFFSYQVSDVALASDVAQLHITIQGSNDTPVAVDDAASATEAGGVANATPGVNPTGNVLANDTDVDAGDTKTVSEVRTGDEAGTGTEGTVGAALVGSYGTLTLNADGTYTYVLDNTNAAVQALRLDTQTLVDNFSYTVSDTAGASDRATLAVTIHGANDTPVAVNDIALSVEAGGVANGTAGTNPSGNVITGNDSDVDSAANGEVLTIASYTEGATAGTVGSAFTTTYGSLLLNADGSYTYTLDNSNAAVQALRTPTDTLTEVFTYTLSDAAGATTTATLTVTISGRDDTPVAVDDTADATEAGGVNNGTPGVDPTGNVLTNDTDVDGGAGSPIDYGETKSVSTVRTGTEAGTGTGGTLGTQLRGNYGWLTLNADGSYVYNVDNNLPIVQALRLNGNTLTDNFSYTVADTAGATDRATLAITIHGADDTPGAVDDTALAIEAGGVGNSTPGFNPGGNVLANDVDVDSNGEALAVEGFRQGLTVGTLGTPFAGAYGTLVLNADGSYSYTVDNDNATVQALRVPTETLTETFTYTLQDALGASSTATLTVTIAGRDDNPIAVDDPLIAKEAGGTLNQTPGIDPSGNLLANDTDVDAGDTKTVDAIRTGTEAAGGTFTDVVGSQAVAGLYGTLTVNADGTFVYNVSNDAFVVQRMRAGDTLTESFTYRMHDTQGASDTAQITVVVQGAWDAPVAQNDVNLAVPRLLGSPGIDPRGNVLANDSDVDRADIDVGTGIRVGDKVIAPPFLGIAVDTDETNGTIVQGKYGDLVIGANGNYIYRVNSFDPTVLALLPGQTVVDSFTYRIEDLGGLIATAQLDIIVRGRNNAPLPAPDQGTAVEAGGLNNATAGFDPSGNVLDNDRDFDGDAMHITDLRTGPPLGTGTQGTVGATLRGTYGDLTLAADGSWHYTLDNTLAEVQALRVSGQTLTDVFTYTVSDVLGLANNAQLTITVEGSNDTPIANDDAAAAVEAGGVHNATPGVNPTGNVLVNDTDVDSVANGETQKVDGFANSQGGQAVAGQALAGAYGQLTINADGSYSYVVDNANPAVEALRTSSETLSETFTYRMSDTAGATSMARLVVVLHGANDNPVAVNDTNTATDQVVAPQASGQVLPNDSDVDGGDAFQVTAIREGARTGSGAAGTVGQASAGLYGTLVIQPDGSYNYSIDLSNPTVLAAAGFGPVLQDVFTYTITDRAGGTAQAQLLITLDISAPFIEAGTHRDLPLRNTAEPESTLGFVPAVFVRPVVERDALVNAISRMGADGSNVEMLFDQGIRSSSIGAGLGGVGGQYVHDAVRASAIASEVELAHFLTRHGRTSLSADGLLSDPSVFGETNHDLTQGPVQRGSNGDLGAASAEEDAPTQTASAFSEQLKLASQRLHPFWYQ